MSIYINGIETLNELILTNKLTVSGNLNLTTVAKSAGYTANSDVFIECNASGSAFTITLPSATSSTHNVYIINKIDSSGNAVTINADASELVDGELTQVLTTQYDVIKIRSNGTTWYTW